MSITTGYEDGSPGNPLWDDLFHACAFTAFVELATLNGDWPESKAVKARAYELYERHLNEKNADRA